MSKYVTFKCDRCGTILEGDAHDKRGVLALTTPQARFVADLCAACSSQVKGDVTFAMKSRPGKKVKAA